MTSVDLPRDDAALKINAKAVAKRNVKPAEGYPVTPAVKEEEQRHTPVPPVQARQRRREGERRQRDEPVLLDTRSGRDRRKQGEEGDGDTPAGHIDVYI